MKKYHVIVYEQDYSGDYFDYRSFDSLEEVRVYVKKEFSLFTNIVVIEGQTLLDTTPLFADECLSRFKEFLNESPKDREEHRKTGSDGDDRLR